MRCNEHGHHETNRGDEAPLCGTHTHTHTHDVRETKEPTTNEETQCGCRQAITGHWSPNTSSGHKNNATPEAWRLSKKNKLRNTHARAPNFGPTHQRLTPGSVEHTSASAMSPLDRATPHCRGLCACLRKASRGGPLQTALAQSPHTRRPARGTLAVQPCLCTPHERDLRSFYPRTSPRGVRPSSHRPPYEW